MSDKTRKRINKWASLISREAVYQTSDAIEVESNEHYEIAQRRVFFDDVLLITYHRERGVFYLVATGIVTLFFVGMAVMFFAMVPNAGAGALIFLAFGLPSLIAFVLRLAFGVDVITVFGRRSRAILRFRLRKQLARETYGQLCATVRAAQRRLEQEYAAEAAADAPPVTESPELPPAG